MSFLAPGRLWLLLAVAALAVAYLILQRRRTRYAVRFTDLALLDKVAPERPEWRRHLPAVLFLAMLGLLVVGFARPTDQVRVPRERATVLLVLDVSPSMRATDVEPSRLQAARDAASVFVDELPPQFNAGLVTFSGSASLVVPPTTDREMLQAAIAALEPTGQRTAIGEAIATALQAIAAFDLRSANEGADDPPPARIVLLSDGGNTAGRSPETAAEEAADAGVPVSTIAYGTPGGSVQVNGTWVPVPADPETLAAVAEHTGGAAYEATSGEELQEVYEDIGSSVGYRTERQEVSARYIGIALLAAVGAAIASLTWFSRLP